jgi:hypothetical protein
MRVLYHKVAILPLSAIAIMGASQSSCDSGSHSEARKVKYVVVGVDNISGQTALDILLSKNRDRDVLALESDAVEAMSVPERRLRLKSGVVDIQFDQLLIATGRHSADSSSSGRRKQQKHDIGDLEGTIDPALFKRKHCHVASSSSSGAVDDLLAKVTGGKHVTIVGGSTNDSTVIETALKLAAAGRRAGYDNVVTVVCPSAGVLSQQMPRYLSMALNRRLNSLGVEIVRYAQIRYIAGIDAVTMPDDDDNDINDVDDDINANDGGAGNVAVFCGHTYDQMNTCSFASDAVLLIGVGEATTTSAASSGNGSGSGGAYDDGGLAYAIQAGLERGNGSNSSSSGTIVVNRSLQAAAGVYVSGRAASVDIGNVALGRGCWAGDEHERESARVAALNMMGASYLYSVVPATHMVCSNAPFMPTTTSSTIGDGEDQKLRGSSSSSSTASTGEVMLSFSSVGLCSAAQDSYGFFWPKRAAPGSALATPAAAKTKASKGAAAAASSSSSSSSSSSRNSSISKSNNTDPTPAPVPAAADAPLQERVMRYFGRDTSGSGKEAEEAPSALMGRGRAAVSRIGDTAATNGSKKGHRLQPQLQQLQQSNGTRVPRSPPLGPGLVFYTNGGVITGVVLAGLAPRATGTSHNFKSNNNLHPEEEAYRELVDYARRLVGHNVEPYISEVPPQEEQEQAVFLFGNPNTSGKFVSTASQLERIAMTALGGYEDDLAQARTSSGNVNVGTAALMPLPRPQYRVGKASMELQRIRAALTTTEAQRRVAPVPFLPEKTATGVRGGGASGGSQYASVKDRVQASYASAMKNNEMKATWSSSSSTSSGEKRG